MVLLQPKIKNCLISKEVRKSIDKCEKVQKSIKKYRLK